MLIDRLGFSKAWGGGRFLLYSGTDECMHFMEEAYILQVCWISQFEDQLYIRGCDQEAVRWPRTSSSHRGCGIGLLGGRAAPDAELHSPLSQPLRYDDGRLFHVAVSSIFIQDSSGPGGGVVGARIEETKEFCTRKFYLRA